MPPALASKPIPGAVVSFLVESFFFLNQFRPVGGMTVANLPLSDLRWYGESVGFSGPHLFGFVEALAQIDSHFVDLLRKKTSQNAS